MKKNETNFFANTRTFSKTSTETDTSRPARKPENSSVKEKTENGKQTSEFFCFRSILILMPLSFPAKKKFFSEG